MLFQQPLEKTLSSSPVTTCLEKHIDHLAILVNSPPQVLLLTINTHQYFVDLECITEPLMSFYQSSGILRPELVAP
jgi:hypothetical protein